MTRTHAPAETPFTGTGRRRAPRKTTSISWSAPQRIRKYGQPCEIIRPISNSGETVCSRNRHPSTMRISGPVMEPRGLTGVDLPEAVGAAEHMELAEAGEAADTFQ